MGRHKERSNESRVLDGSFRPSRHGAVEAEGLPCKCAQAAREVPEGLEALADLWRETLADLEARDLLDAGNLGYLADGFRMLATVRRMQSMIDESGNLDQLLKLQRIQASAAAQAARIFSRFGILTPLDRARVKPAKDPARVTDWLAQMRESEERR